MDQRFPAKTSTFIVRSLIWLLVCVVWAVLGVRSFVAADRYQGAFYALVSIVSLLGAARMARMAYRSWKYEKRS